VESTGSEYADSSDSNCISIWIRDGEYLRVGLLDTRLIIFLVFFVDLIGLVIALIYIHREKKTELYIYHYLKEKKKHHTYVFILMNFYSNSL
jgi:hypothetical protein